MARAKTTSYMKICILRIRVRKLLVLSCSLARPVSGLLLCRRVEAYAGIDNDDSGEARSVSANLPFQRSVRASSARDIKIGNTKDGVRRDPSGQGKNYEKYENSIIISRLTKVLVLLCPLTRRISGFLLRISIEVHPGIDNDDSVEVRSVKGLFHITANWPNQAGRDTRTILRGRFELLPLQ